VTAESADNLRTEPGVDQVCLLEVGAHEVGILGVGAHEVGVFKVGVDEEGVLELAVHDVRLLEVGTCEIGILVRERARRHGRARAPRRHGRPGARSAADECMWPDSGLAVCCGFSVGSAVLRSRTLDWGRCGGNGGRYGFGGAPSRDLRASADAEVTYQRLFGPRDTNAPDNDPELMEILRGFIFGDIFGTGVLDDQARELIIVTVLACLQTLPQLTSHTGAALNVGVQPVEIREAIYQLAPFLGFPRTLNAVATINEVFQARDIQLPLCRPTISRTVGRDAPSATGPVRKPGRLGRGCPGVQDSKPARPHMSVARAKGDGRPGDHCKAVRIVVSGPPIAITNARAVPCVGRLPGVRVRSGSDEGRRGVVRSPRSE
jgi:alkylhydroperoxidase/carboxymuconolactone decarboxylase family protein YurZ